MQCAAIAAEETLVQGSRRMGARTAQFTCVCVGVLLLASCSGGPTRVSAPEIDPAEAGAEAIRLYDADGDGKLSQDELKSCPGILLHLTAYDADGDGAVSREEIAEQLKRLTAAKIGQTILQISVDLNGRPLPGAEVRLVPEPYLGEAVMPAYGTTSRGGIAVMDIRDEDLPASEHGIVGVHLGTYKIEVTHPSVEIPERYNSQTILGFESELGNPGFKLTLKK